MMKMKIALCIERVARTKFVLFSLSFTLFESLLLTGAGPVSTDWER